LIKIWRLLANPRVKGYESELVNSHHSDGSRTITFSTDADGERKWVRKKDKKALEKIFDEEVTVDFLLATLLKEADLEVDMDTWATIKACHVLEALKLVDGSEKTIESQDGTVTTHYMFIATEELRELMVADGMLIETMV
jgi:hypothetical protein